MTQKEIEQLANERYPTAKDSLTTISERKGWFETDREEQWYNLGLYDGATANHWHFVAYGDLPEKTGNYLCSDGEESIVAFYSHVSGGFFNPLEKYGEDYNDLVKYWMEIPQLPNIRKIIK